MCFSFYFLFLLSTTLHITPTSINYQVYQLHHTHVSVISYQTISLLLCIFQSLMLSLSLPLPLGLYHTIISSARAIAVHTSPLAITRTTSKTLAAARCAHWAATTEKAAWLNTVQDATSVAKVCLHAARAALPCIPGTARLCVATLAL